MGANALGVSCGAPLGLPIRARITTLAGSMPGTELTAAPEKKQAAVSGSRLSRAAIEGVVSGIWALLLCCVVAGSVLPATSSVMLEVGRLPLNGNGLHFCAYLSLSLLPLIGFRSRSRAIAAAFSVFVLSMLLEGAQSFSPGRCVEFGDVVANGLGVSCGALLGLPIRASITTIAGG